MHSINKLKILLPLLLATQLMNSCQKKDKYINVSKPEVILSGTDQRLQAAVISLSSDTVYILTTNIIRNAGELLEIQAGTLIKVQDNHSIIINEGATINAQGNETSPIVFTSDAYTSGAGLQCGTCIQSHAWNGIFIYGNSLGTNPVLSSGSLSFVRIEFAGADQNNALPSLLLKNVNNQTSVNHIQISYSTYSPSYEFDGGNVNATHLISYASNRSDFYLHSGYHGMMQQLLAYRHPYFPVSETGRTNAGTTLAGIFIDGQGDTTTAPVISNATVLGPDPQTGINFDYFQLPPLRRSALVATGQCRFQIRNSVFMGFPKTAFYIDDYSTAHDLHFFVSSFSHCIVQSADSSRTFFLPPDTYLPFNSGDFKAYMIQPDAFYNYQYLNASDFKFIAPQNYDSDPRPTPSNDSPLLSGADFSDILFSNSFFEKVNYLGASGNDNWFESWSNFTPLQINYNH